MTRARTAKPLRADAVRNRARVLEVALATFAEEGLSVPIDEIARRVGVGVGTIYRHFPTKEALLAAIVVDRMARLVVTARALADAEDPGEAFFGFLQRWVDEAAAKKDLHDAIAASGFVMPVKTRLELKAAMKVLLDRAKAAGAVRPDVDVEELLALVKGTFVAVAAMGGDARTRHRVLAVVCDGLRRIPPAAHREARVSGPAADLSAGADKPDRPPPKSPRNSAGRRRHAAR